MKLILREYLASLKERGELDAILPDLLSELGFNVFSRPGRGTTQHGVDVAAVGPDEDGQEKLFLLSVKQGNLTRQDWNGTPQALRPSLDEIQDVYIPTKVASEHSQLKIVICLCFGGDVNEQVRPALTGYINQHTTERISFREWNGDKLAELLLSGIRREDILPRHLRSHFQKAVAMLDEPDVSYHHFVELSRLIAKSADASDAQRVTSARQIYVCLWILYVWARDSENLEAPYRLSEFSILAIWDLLRHFVGKRTNAADAISLVFIHLIQLHMSICSEFLEKKILPHVGKRDAISLAMPTRTSADVNLKLFELLGRISMTGLWLVWLAQRFNEEAAPEFSVNAAEWLAKALDLIQNNRALFLPLCDQHAIEVCLLLLLASYTESGKQDIVNWLEEMTNFIDITVRTHGKYPCVFTDYADLIVHPREQSEAYREEATSGSILIPLIAAWLTAIHDQPALKKLSDLKEEALAHCTFQFWLPDSSTEDSLYVGGRDHGVALSDVPVREEGEDLLNLISEACEKDKSFEYLSAITTNHWPVVLLACKHFRLPIPPQFWIHMLRAPEKADAA